MAVLAHICRARVLRVLAGCDGAVMTAKAITGDIGVVVGSRQPGDRRVTVVAVVTTRDVVRIFARGNGAVMARAATAEYLRVIDGERRQPDRRRVAVLADISR